MKVECEIHTLDDSDPLAPGVCVECGRCGHEVSVRGDTDRSVRRGLAMLREQCPEGETNYYVDPEAEE